MQIRKILILLFISTTIFSYKLPFSQQQRIYFGETLNKRSYSNFSFKIEDKEYKIDKSSLKSDDLLTYILANLFLNHKKSLLNFQKKHSIIHSKSYYRLYNDIPVIIYGNDAKVKEYNIDDFKPEIWLNNEQAYPVKVVFKKDGKIVIAEFPEYNNQKLNYLVPTKVIITVNGEKKIYQLTF